MVRFLIIVEGYAGPSATAYGLADAYTQARAIFETTDKSRRVLVCEVVGSLEPRSGVDIARGKRRGDNGKHGKKALTGAGASEVPTAIATNR